MDRPATNNLRPGIGCGRKERAPQWYPDDFVPEAAALSYDKRSMLAPEVCAVGRFEAAKKMRDVARRFGVPVIQDPQLAERLCALRQNTPVPASIYPDVARVLIGSNRRK